MTEDPTPSADAPAGASSEADPRVERALGRMGELAGSAPGDHVEIYDDVHRSLQEVLAQAAEGTAAGVHGAEDDQTLGAGAEDAGR